MHHNVTKCSDTIVQVIGYGYELNQNADTVESLALVMEYCPGGNLEEYIELQKDKGPIEEKQILNWLYDLSDALTKMHEAGVIIADLKYVVFIQYKCCQTSVDPPISHCPGTIKCGYWILERLPK